MVQRLHEKLVVWKEAYALCLSVYDLTRRFPSEEKFGLTSQMRRSAYSVPMNIAEGNVQRTGKGKRKYHDIALGSLEELHCQAKLASDLHYMDSEQFHKLDQWICRVSFLMNRLRSSVKI